MENLGRGTWERITEISGEGLMTFLPLPFFEGMSTGQPQGSLMSSHSISSKDSDNVTLGHSAMATPFLCSCFRGVCRGCGSSFGLGRFKCLLSPVTSTSFTEQKPASFIFASCSVNSGFIWLPRPWVMKRPSYTQVSTLL